MVTETSTDMLKPNFKIFMKYSIVHRHESMLQLPRGVSSGGSKIKSYHSKLCPCTDVNDEKISQDS